MLTLDTIVARDQYFGNILDQIAELKEDVNRIQISAVDYSDLERKIVRGVATQSIRLGAGGELIAGADDDVALNEDGITFDVGSTYAEGKSLTWKDGTGVVAEIYGQRSTGVWHSLTMRTKATDPYGYADVKAEGTAGGIASILAGTSSNLVGIIAGYDPVGSGVTDTWTIGRFNAESLAVVGNSAEGEPGAPSISLSDGEAWFNADVHMGGGLAIGVTGSTTSLGTGDLHLEGSIIKSTAIWGSFYRTTTYNLTSSVSQTITWQTQVADTDTIWSSGTNLNINTTGIYLIWASATFANTSNAGRRTIYILRNGASIVQHSVACVANSTTTTMQATAIDSFSDSQYASVQVRQNSGSNLVCSLMKVALIRIA